ncbi:signal recognition particle-docking protein FtsY, partial [Vibrio cholerae]|nr:signal recognition particle-docking protein FtsY [Vibrio cholerae]
MTEKKKRGLLSWLGFGDEEKSQTTATDTQTQDEPQSQAD